VDKLSGESGLNRSQLHRRIKQITGENTSLFIRKIRLEKAMEILKNDWSTAAEVSYKTEFSSPAYFLKCFKKHFGYPPGEVKKREPEPAEEKTENDSTVQNRVNESTEEKTIFSRSDYLNTRIIFYTSLAIIAVLILVYSLFPRFGSSIKENSPDQGQPQKSIALYRLPT
jgi:AraC-like DNA-binding protein